MVTKKPVEPENSATKAAPELVVPAETTTPEPETAAPVPAAEHVNADHESAPEPAPVKRARTAKAAAVPVDSAATAPVEAAPVDTVPVESVPVVAEPITASSDPETKVLAETTPAAHPAQEVIVVDAPVAPKKRTNRLAGIGFAALASILFTVLFALAVFVIGFVANGRPSISFLASPTFYWPVVLFFLSLILVIAVVNTAGWWTYIITSVVVAAGVYFGTAAVLLVLSGVLSMSQQEANAVYFAALANPITIAAALIAREVSIWTGAILARRGRKVRQRNVEAREAYEREQAELIPTA
jgi:hypothetical protein